MKQTKSGAAVLRARNPDALRSIELCLLNPNYLLALNQSSPEFNQSSPELRVSTWAAPSFLPLNSGFMI
jgi:hypothetical protein